MAVYRDLIIRQGETFARNVRWGSPSFSYAAITAASQAAPVQLTATAHGIPAGWRAAVVGVHGMRQLNAVNDPPHDSDYHAVSVVDVNTLKLDVNASGFSAYTSGGALQFHTPMSLAGYTAHMEFVGANDASILTLTSGSGITLDDTTKTISIAISATATAALARGRGKYSLEVVSGGVVTTLMTGEFSITPAYAVGDSGGPIFVNA